MHISEYNKRLKEKEIRSTGRQARRKVRERKKKSTEDES